MSHPTRRNLRAITADGMAFSVMVGAGETYVPAFALAIGLGEVTAGWVASLPLLAGAVLQLIAPAGVRRLRSRRRWVVLCAVAQALSMLGFAACAAAGAVPTAVLYLVATAYWATGLATGPAWNAWVGTLVPKRLRARFFARRSRFAHMAVLASLVLAGLALHVARPHGAVLSVFIVLFIAAGLARLVSAGFLASQSEPAPPDDHGGRVSLRDLLARRDRAHGRLLLYMLAVQGAAQVAGPFFTPYMLSELHFDYAHYLVLIGVSFMTKMVMLPFVGELVHRFGARRMLVVSGMGIVPMSALWIVSDEFLFLLAVQVVAGAMWAVYELTTFLLLFDHIPERDRVAVLTTYNLAHAAMTVSGALVGGTVLRLMGEERAGYLVLFALSSVLRLFTLILLLRTARVSVRRFAVAVRALAVRPNGASHDVPIVSSLPDEERPSRR